MKKNKENCESKTAHRIASWKNSALWTTSRPDDNCITQLGMPKSIESIKTWWLRVWFQVFFFSNFNLQHQPPEYDIFQTVRIYHKLHPDVILLKRSDMQSEAWLPVPKRHFKLSADERKAKLCFGFGLQPLLPTGKLRCFLLHGGIMDSLRQWNITPAGRQIRQPPKSLPTIHPPLSKPDLAVTRDLGQMEEWWEDGWR